MKKALNKSEAVSKIKEGYIEEIKFIFGTDNIPEKEKSRFSFLGDKNITLCICSYTWHKRTWYIFFAHKTPSDDIKLEFYDFSVETNNYDFENITLNQRIEWLINKNLLNIRQENIIWNSVNNGIFIQESNLMEFGSNWAKNEYEQTNKILQKNTKVERFPVINQHFFVDRYHFDDMLKSINDDQFSDEFNQCLFAYNHEKWFLCATGLGSCLEHLMYIIIANYGDFKNLEKNQLSKIILQNLNNLLLVSVRDKQHLSRYYLWLEIRSTIIILEIHTKIYVTCYSMEFQIFITIITPIVSLLRKAIN